MSTVSPELALVDPELRAHAVAALPHVHPYTFLELRPVVVVQDAPAPAPASAFRPSAALAYLLLAIARTAAFDAVVFASVFACVLLANLFA